MLFSPALSAGVGSREFPRHGNASAVFMGYPVTEQNLRSTRPHSHETAAGSFLTVLAIWKFLGGIKFLRGMSSSCNENSMPAMPRQGDLENPK